MNEHDQDPVCGTCGCGPCACDDMGAYLDQIDDNYTERENAHDAWVLSQFMTTITERES